MQIPYSAVESCDPDGGFSDWGFVSSLCYWRAKFFRFDRGHSSQNWGTLQKLVWFQHADENLECCFNWIDALKVGVEVDFAGGLPGVVMNFLNSLDKRELLKIDGVGMR